MDVRSNEELTGNFVYVMAQDFIFVSGGKRNSLLNIPASYSEISSSILSPETEYPERLASYFPQSLQRYARSVAYLQLAHKLFQLIIH
jgi:hypothetical protein